MKVPQILALRKAKSAEGLSASSFELEQIGYSIHSTYGFIMGLPFTAYGEAIIMLLQNTFLLCQVYYYSRAPFIRPLAMIMLFAGLGFYVTSGEKLTCNLVCAWTTFAVQQISNIQG